jgi:hypothetical protein
MHSLLFKKENKRGSPPAKLRHKSWYIYFLIRHSHFVWKQELLLLYSVYINVGIYTVFVLRTEIYISCKPVGWAGRQPYGIFDSLLWVFFECVV